MRIPNQLRYKLTHITRFPKGKLSATLINLAKRGFAPRHIIDVGANQGRWSRDALEVFPRAGFTLIEPQIEMAAHLKRFCEQHPNSRWIQAGAGAEPGQLVFTVIPDTVSSSFVISEESAKAGGHERRMVKVVTLDQVADELGLVPEMIKIDAEGFEQQVLQGASSLIGKTEVILLEAHMMADDDDPSSFIQLVDLMSKYGYAPYDFTWFGKRPYDGAIALTEVLFARKDGILRAHKDWGAKKSQSKAA